MGAATARAGVRGRIGPASLTGGAEEAIFRSRGTGATSPRREDGGDDSAALIFADPDRSYGSGSARSRSTRSRGGGDDFGGSSVIGAEPTSSIEPPAPLSA